MRAGITLICSWIGLAVIASGLLLAQTNPTVRLLEGSAAGDDSQEDESGSMHLNIRLSSGGNLLKQMQMEQTEQKSYRNQVLDVNARGHAQAIRRTYRVARTTEKNDQDEKTTVSSLEGKTITIRRQGSHVEVKSASGTLAEKDRKSLLDALDNERGRFFPDHAMAVGEEWTPDPATLAKMFQGAQSLSMRCKLVEVGPYRGRSCAHIHISLTVKMPMPGVSTLMTIQLQGEGYQDLGVQRPLLLSLDGPITASGVMQVNGTECQLSCTGSMQMRMSDSWHKIAGHSVP